MEILRLPVVIESPAAVPTATLWLPSNDALLSALVPTPTLFPPAGPSCIQKYPIATLLFPLSQSDPAKLPIKVFILNNQYMGMVRQWQELLHEKNYSESYTAALPDFVKLAEAYGCVGIRANKPEELDKKIAEMLSVNKPVIFDCVVDKEENCYPMIPSGKAHNQMLLGKKDDEDDKISEEGKILV